MGDNCPPSRIIDNSSVTAPFRPVLEIENDRLTAMTEVLPCWTERALGDTIASLIGSERERLLADALAFEARTGGVLRRTPQNETGIVEGKILFVGAVHVVVLDDAGVWHVIGGCNGRTDLAAGMRIRGFVEHGRLRILDREIVRSRPQDPSELLDAIVSIARAARATQVDLDFEEDGGCVAFHRLEDGAYVRAGAYTGGGLAEAVDRRARPRERDDLGNYAGEIDADGTAWAVVVYRHLGGRTATIRLDAATLDEVDMGIALRRRILDESRTHLDEWNDADVRTELIDHLDRLSARELAQFDLLAWSHERGYRWNR